ncbi:NAD(P)/FAD-dependent oxidoreductase [Cyanobacterium sp. IPPAS B-1200]|uniref:NAD(P)/FAD-dependent oxidoreductase n=1 Tax=Cyanobacterium sp. IPPAS B-1200 TaxID=1562720 RepID=UPI000852559F|nr:FAD-dependent oxidoreductase [Cyanobacterium sp. IPPAS B-1200]OEJ77637.1 FAD-dependent oxidoreductase [Cyanobacterium sp. IPPAS B-1200]
MNYDVIVVGAGLTGSALAYELAKKGQKVLLVEKNLNFSNGTVYSYGGIAYWCGTDDRTISLCQEGIKIQRGLSDELDYDTQYRDLDLLFTIPHDKNPEQVRTNYQNFWIQPELLSVEDSCGLEPLLNREAISGCLRFPHGHVNPHKLIIGYQIAFKRLGGEIREELVVDLEKKGSRTVGIKTSKNSYFAPEIILCAGAFCRSLLRDVGVSLPIYFTHAQLIKTKPTDIKLRCLIMPSTTARFLMEEDVTALAKDTLWENPNDELQGEVLEPGAIQFLDGSLCLGQISQIRTNTSAPVDARASEDKIRGAIAHYLPALGTLEGQWHNCQVAFSKNVPFQVGRVEQIEGLSVFSGFTSPFVFVPTLAQKFAHFLATDEGDFPLKTS